MATIPFKKIKLNESDAPNGLLPLPPEQCSVEVLKKYVATRGIPTAGLRKTELVKLTKDIISRKIGISQDAEKGRIVAEKARVLRSIELNANSSNLDIFPVNGWKNFPSMEIPQHFHFGSIYKYLVESATVVDSDGEMEGLNDYGTKKPLARGRQYFRSGHVQQLKDALTKSKRYCVKGLVKSSMREAQYTVMVMIDSMGDVLDAECHCRGSALQRCSHVAAILVALEDYTSLFGFSPPACTSVPCSWNQGGKEKRADPVYHFQYSNIRDPSRAINFNTNIMTQPDKVINELLALTSHIRSLFPRGTKWETILDFKYEDYVVDDCRKMVLTELVEQFVQSLAFGFLRPSEVPNTRAQSSSEEWLRLRRMYITASAVKRFLRVPRGDVTNLLRSNMWYPSTFTSKYTTWGVQNEENAKNTYIQKTGNSVADSGLWVNPSFPGLAASPDGIVLCKTTETWGVLEVKCPYTLKDHCPADFEQVLTPQQRSAFCLKKEGGHITLKPTHNYYHQIQMVMGIVGLKWCDFVVWTPKDIWCHRIPFNEKFWIDISKDLLLFHKRYMAVDYSEMRTPRRLPPVTID